MRWLRPIIFLLFSFWAAEVLACAVCMGKEDISSRAYLRSTIMMSLVPLAALGGLAYFLYRTSKRAKAQNQE